MKVLLVSGQARYRFVFDACSYDFEDAARDALGADLMTAETDIAGLAPRYDLILVIAVSFFRMHALSRDLLARVRDRAAGPVLGYVFGGYGAVARRARNPFHRLARNWQRGMGRLDRLHLGIGDDVEKVSRALGVPARYLPMFWQLLRRSRVSVAFDHFFANEGSAQISYVGPRRFEALAAGTVVLGKAPPSADRALLLDWPDAAIDLSDDPAAATDELVALLEDEPRLAAASRRNIVEMARRHDWSHRLAEMLRVEGLGLPDRLVAHIGTLEARAAALESPEARTAPDYQSATSSGSRPRPASVAPISPR